MKLQALPQQLPWPHAPSLGLCKEVRREKGRKRRFLKQLPWPGSPSAALGSLQMGSGMESKNWRAESEPKPRGQVSVCIAGFGQSILYLRKALGWNMPPTKGQAEQRLQDCVFWPASPHSSAETQRLWQDCCNWCTLETGEAINSQSLKWRACQSWGFFFSATCDAQNANLSGKTILFGQRVQ